MMGCMDESSLQQQFVRQYRAFEVRLNNIRHLQHHTGQLADRLRTAAGIGVAWIRMG